MKKTILPIVMITLLIVLSGCIKGYKVETADAMVDIEISPIVQETTIQEKPATEQKLLFTVAASENPGYTASLNLAEVNIRMSGQDISLPEVIRTGVLTVPEIFAFAQIDAQNGFCKESFVSEHGLSHFS